MSAGKRFLWVCVVAIAAVSVWVWGFGNSIPISLPMLFSRTEVLSGVLSRYDGRNPEYNFQLEVPGGEPIPLTLSSVPDSLLDQRVRLHVRYRSSGSAFRVRRVEPIPGSPDSSSTTDTASEDTDRENRVSHRSDSEETRSQASRAVSRSLDRFNRAMRDLHAHRVEIDRRIEELDFLAGRDREDVEREIATIAALAADETQELMEAVTAAQERLGTVSAGTDEVEPTLRTLSGEVEPELHDLHNFFTSLGLGD